MNTISNSDDVIDSRDVIERIEELESSLQSDYEVEVTNRIEELEEELTTTHEAELQDSEDVEEDFETWLAGSSNPDVDELKSLRETNFDKWLDESSDLVNEDVEELKKLQALAEEAEGYAEDWRHGATLIRESYFEEYCEELCKDIGDLPKNIPSYIEIDWAATADNLRVDYTEVEYDGVTYLVR